MSSTSNHPIQYGVFDILYSNNVSVMGLPLAQRKQLLKEILPAGNTTIFPIPYIEGRASDYFNQVVLNDLEGIVRKTGHSPVLFMVREYPIICTLCHVPLYNTQDTFHPHIFHMQT